MNSSGDRRTAASSSRLPALSRARQRKTKPTSNASKPEPSIVPTKTLRSSGEMSFSSEYWRTLLAAVAPQEQAERCPFTERQRGGARQHRQWQQFLRSADENRSSRRVRSTRHPGTSGTVSRVGEHWGSHGWQTLAGGPSAQLGQSGAVSSKKSPTSRVSICTEDRGSSRSAARGRPLTARFGADDEALGLACRHLQIPPGDAVEFSTRCLRRCWLCSSASRLRERRREASRFLTLPGLSVRHAQGAGRS